jgi:hypothetical protein
MALTIDLANPTAERVINEALCSDTSSCHIFKTIERAGIHH